MKNLKLGQYDGNANSIYLFASSFMEEQELFLSNKYQGVFYPVSLTKEQFLAKHYQTIKIYNRYLPEIAQYLNEKNHVNFSLRFWHPFLAYWMVTIIDNFFDKKIKLETFFANWKEGPVEIALVDCSNDCIFENDRAFNYGHGTSHLFEQLFSSYVIKAINPAGHIIKNTALETVQIKDPLPTKKNQFRMSGRIEHVAGFNKLQLSLLNTVLNLKAAAGDKSSTPLKTNNFSNEINFEWMSLFTKMMPASYLSIDLKNKSVPFSRGEVFFSSYKTPEKRIFVGLLREKGVNAYLVQHGSNYGDQLTVTRNYLTEYCLDGFISWGWKDHDHHPANIISLPSPIMSKLKLRKIFSPYRRKKIILISSVYAPNDNAGSYETAEFYPDYYKNICLFLDNLDEETKKVFYFRPRLTHGETTFNNALVKLIGEKFPWVRILEGSLDKELLKASIVVHDNFGSALQKSLLLAPVNLYFWRKNSFFLNDRLDKIFREIELNHGYFTNGKEAAIEVNRIHREGLKYPELIRLNKKLRSNFFQTSFFPLLHWIKALWSI